MRHLVRTADMRAITRFSTTISKTTLQKESQLSKHANKIKIFLNASALFFFCKKCDKLEHNLIFEKFLRKYLVNFKFFWRDFFMNRREFIKNAAMGIVAINTLGIFPEKVFAANDADLVVFGKIFTAENNQLVEAFAVKDGKYIFVGDKKNAEKFIQRGKTEIIDYTGKGLVMPSCGNGHAHYLSAYAVETFGTMVDRNDSVEKFLKETVPAAVKNARETGKKVVYCMGWNTMEFLKNLPRRQQLDEICSDIPMFLADEENHKALVNTIALVNAGIMSKDGKVLKKEIRGGEIVFGEDGTPSLYSVDFAKKDMAKVEQKLLSEGYTMYLDGFSTYLFNDTYYKAAQQRDDAGKMKFILGTTYEIESWMDVEKNLKKAVEMQKYSSEHVKTNWIKLFMNGTVETGTGFVEPLYPDGH